MKNKMLFIGVLACALSLPLVGCGGTPSASTGDDSAQEQTSDFDAIEAYWGQWHGSVKTTGESIYGTTGGEEAMLDIYLNEDGSCSVEPVETHADLLTDEGTWEGTEEQVVLHLSTGDITITMTGPDTAEAVAANFGVEGFELISFDFYG